MVNLGVVLVKR